MKKLRTAMLVICLLLTMAGCASAGLAQKMDTAEEKTEQRLDTVEDAVENAVRKAAAPAPAVRETQADSAAATRITREEAQKIALDSVGLTEDQVQRLRTKLEKDDGIIRYDVEFLTDIWEFEFEIDAENGNILSFDKDDRQD